MDHTTNRPPSPEEIEAARTANGGWRKNAEAVEMLRECLWAVETLYRALSGGATRERATNDQVGVICARTRNLRHRLAHAIVAAVGGNQGCSEADSGSYSLRQWWPDPPMSASATTLSVLRAVQELYASGKGVPPTVREIQTHLNISSPGVVAFHLQKLTRLGWIVCLPGKARSCVPLVQTPEGLTFPSIVAPSLTSIGESLDCHESPAASSTSPATCPRCDNRVYRSFPSEPHTCLICGWEDYSTTGMSAEKRLPA